MNRAIRLLQNYLVLALPPVLACIIWEAAQPGIEFPQSAPLAERWLWEALAWNLMLWFSALPLFLILLIVAPSVREKTLKRLANLKDEDEREENITGRAARFAYISSLSVLILLLFVSVLSLDVTRLPEGETVDGHHGTVAIGLHFDLLDKSQTAPGGDTLFALNGLPLSKSAIVLVLLFWQLLSFNIAAKREFGEQSVS